MTNANDRRQAVSWDDPAAPAYTSPAGAGAGVDDVGQRRGVGVDGCRDRRRGRAR